MKKNICTRHPVWEMVQCCVWMLSSTLGTMVQEKQKSVKDRLARVEVHGGMEAGVRADGQDDEQVPQHGDQVHGQEEPEQVRLLLWVLREAQEQEVRGVLVWFVMLI